MGIYKSIVVRKFKPKTKDLNILFQLIVSDKNAKISQHTKSRFGKFRGYHRNFAEQRSNGAVGKKRARHNRRKD